MAIDGLALAHLHANDAFDEAGDHAAVVEIHVHRIGASSFDFGPVIAVGAFETKNSDITLFCGTSFDGNNSGELLAGIFNHAVDPRSVIDNGFVFRLQAFGAFQLWRWGHIGLQRERQFIAGVEAFQQSIEATAQVGLADGLKRFLLDGVTPGAIDQLF